MSYVDEIYERVVAQNPGEPEFHQAVKEVLDSLKLVIDANRASWSVLQRLSGLFRCACRGWMIWEMCRSIKVTECSLTAPLDLTRADFVSILP